MFDYREWLHKLQNRKRRNYYEDREKAVYRIEDGESKEAIAKEFQVTVPTINKWIREFVPWIIPPVWGGEKRKFVCDEYKVAALDRLKNGETKAEVAKHYNVVVSTVTNWLKNEQKIRESHKEGCEQFDLPCPKRRRLSTAKVDNGVMAWLKDELKKGTELRTSDVMATARRLNQEFQGSDRFNPGTGWLNKFKRRHGIRSKMGVIQPTLVKVRAIYPSYYRGYRDWKGTPPPSDNDTDSDTDGQDDGPAVKLTSFNIDIPIDRPTTDTDDTDSDTDDQEDAPTANPSTSDILDISFNINTPFNVNPSDTDDTDTDDSDDGPTVNPSTSDTPGTSANASTPTAGTSDNASATPGTSVTPATPATPVASVTAVTSITPATSASSRAPATYVPTTTPFSSATPSSSTSNIPRFNLDAYAHKRFQDAEATRGIYDNPYLDPYLDPRMYPNANRRRRVLNISPIASADSSTSNTQEAPIPSTEPTNETRTPNLNDTFTVDHSVFNEGFSFHLPNEAETETESSNTSTDSLYKIGRSVFEFGRTDGTGVEKIGPTHACIEIADSTTVTVNDDAAKSYVLPKIDDINSQLLEFPNFDARRRHFSADSDETIIVGDPYVKDEDFNNDLTTNHAKIDDKSDRLLNPKIEIDDAADSCEVETVIGDIRTNSEIGLREIKTIQENDHNAKSNASNIESENDCVILRYKPGKIKREVVAEDIPCFTYVPPKTTPSIIHTTQPSQPFQPSRSTNATTQPDSICIRDVIESGEQLIQWYAGCTEATSAGLEQLHDIVNVARSQLRNRKKSGKITDFLVRKRKR